MSTMTSWIKIVTVVCSAATLFACSNGNDTGSTVDNSGKHVANWVKLHPAAATTATTSCTECHGAELTGGVARISCMSAAPISGFKCHVTSPAAAPSGCTSCHGAPPTGTTFPNRQFAHDVHTVLPGVTCSTCHAGLGFGTANHADGTHVISLAPAVQAKTLTTSFTFNPAADPAAGTGFCSGVSCHGGQPTPGWSQGAIELATDCRRCHEQGAAQGTPQYNSFYSGTFAGTIPATNLHEFHLRATTLNTAGAPVFCTDCHNIGILMDNQQHFGGLTTNTFTAPENTIGGVPTSIGNYDKPTKTCNNVACHNFNARWQ